MKSNSNNLAGRGFLEKGTENTHLSMPVVDKINLLQSNVPTERTLAARLLSTEKNSFVVEKLIEALKKEKKLYPKIEICNALVSIGQASIKPLVAELGNIGGNQHNRPSEKEFEKDSYPLPRDIVARTLAHIGTYALPELLLLLSTKNERQLSEAIDAIGFICFYNPQENVFELLRNCFSEYINNDLIRWKIYRSMSAFPESKIFLQLQQETEKSESLQKEISRSLRLIE